MTLGCWKILDYFISCSYTLHHSWGANVHLGDLAYPLRVQLQGPHKNAVLTPAIQAFYTSMSHVRIAVELLFGDTANYLS